MISDYGTDTCDIPCTCNETSTTSERCRAILHEARRAAQQKMELIPMNRKERRKFAKLERASKKGLLNKNKVIYG